MSRLLIMGVGGHGRVVAEAAMESGACSEVAFLDDQYPDVRETDGYAVIGRIDYLQQAAGESHKVAVALGDNTKRVELILSAIEAGHRCPPIIHPAAFVSRRATLGDGTVVLANAVVGVGASLGRGCIANTGCTVDHDCVLADGVHVSPGAHLAGSVQVGLFSWIGLGATVNQELHVGDNAVVGASAGVIEDLPSGAKVVGVPAKQISG